MKTAVIILICLALSVLAFERTHGSGGHNPAALVRGDYTIVDSYEVGLETSYGLAIQDDVTDILWLCNWGELLNYEVDMGNGQLTGNTWAIVDDVDPDDEAYCEYGSGNQFFIGDWASNNIGVFDDSGNFEGLIEGPAGWSGVYGVGAGHDMLYVSDKAHVEIAWGSYTGTESSVSWTTAAFETVYGMAVYGDYIFMSCGIAGADNIFIFSINADGSLDMTPVWSTIFYHEPEPDGGLDWDGEYLWLYPQNTSLFKLDIDWVPVSLEQSTWGQIKADF